MDALNDTPNNSHNLMLVIIIIIIISGFGIYGAAVVPDSGVGNTWQRLTLVLHEFLSNGLTPSRLHIVISFLTHADHVFLGLPRSLVPGSPKSRDGVDARSGTLQLVCINPSPLSNSHSFSVSCCCLFIMLMISETMCSGLWARCELGSLGL